MAKLKTDAPLARRIANSILHFLNSVEPASEVDEEGLEVAKECLSEAFKINLPSVGTVSTSESLIDIFSSSERNGSFGHHRDFHHEGSSGDAPCSSSARNAVSTNTTQSQVDGCAREDHTFGTSEDELFGQYFGALEKIHYFSLPDGNDDPARLDRATNIFYKALEEMQRSGCETFDQRNLAETLKVQGNKVMQTKLYHDAVELYTIAIALCDDSAVYYCNRAAAYTQIGSYHEAVRDCMKSIDIDPNYSKAYSRLGFAYYAQGRYRAAIDEGFIKALRLDPDNASLKENIRVTEAKLREEQQRARQNQGSTSTSQQSSTGSRSHSMPPQFNFQMPSIPVDIASMLRNMASNMPQGSNFQSGREGTTADLGSMFTNMASNVSQGQPFQTTEHESVPNVPNDPEIRIGGDVNLDFVDGMSGDLSGALRSIREMLSGGAPRASPEDNAEGRHTPR